MGVKIAIGAGEGSFIHAVANGPADGYAAWLDAGALTYQGYDTSTPAVADDDPVIRWDSGDGTYPIAFTMPGGYGACTLKTAANGINGYSVVRSVAAEFDVLRDHAQAATFDGDLLSTTSGTVFCVTRIPVINAALVRGAWGDANGLVGLRFYDFGSGPVAQAVITDSGGSAGASKAITAAAAHIVTFLWDSPTLYCGVDDTRTASMSSASTVGDGILPAANFAVLMGQAGPGQYLDGDMAEILFYPTALSEADRKRTEQYLASKYGISTGY